MPNMKLYYFETPNGRKACAVAQYLNSPVEFVRVDLTKGEQKRPDFLAINPNGKIPALTDGPMKLWESDAIMCHLARKAGSGLWPSDGARQIEVLRWLLWDATHFSRHANTLFFENVIKVRFFKKEPNRAAVEEATDFFKQFAAVLDAHLAGRDTIVGDGLTIADFAVAALLPTAKEAKLPLDGFAEIMRWHTRLLDIPAWREPFPAKAAAAA